jgi:hypothetical protein
MSSQFALTVSVKCVTRPPDQVEVWPAAESPGINTEDEMVVACRTVESVGGRGTH